MLLITIIRLCTCSTLEKDASVSSKMASFRNQDIVIPNIEMEAIVSAC